MVSASRLFADRRLLVVTLAVLAAANLLVLALVLGPLGARVQTLTQRATVASLGATTAARDLETARLTASGTQRASTDLDRFYREILPANQPAARQVTFLRMAQVAREARLTYDRRAFAQEAVEKGVLTRATLTTSVFGDYRKLRDFLYRVETGPEFVVIRQVSVGQSDDPAEPLEATLVLATYYKAGDDR